MSSYIKKLDELKVKLFRLHFLLTEEQTEPIKMAGLEQFKICYEGAMECLELFIMSEHNKQSKSYKNSLELAFKYRLFNQKMIESMHQMLEDYNLAQKGAKLETVYQALQEKYAGFLQMIFDMLTHMGEDPQEEK